MDECVGSGVNASCVTINKWTEGPEDSAIKLSQPASSKWNRYFQKEARLLPLMKDRVVSHESLHVPQKVW
jgi:hypothetical protein